MNVRVGKPAQHHSVTGLPTSQALIDARWNIPGVLVFIGKSVPGWPVNVWTPG